MRESPSRDQWSTSEPLAVPPPPALTAEDGMWLVHLATDALRKHLQGLAAEDPAHSPGPRSEPASVFVSVYACGTLRGCLGALEPNEPLWRSVQRMVVAAASEDPRFEPLKAGEAGILSVEVTVLGPRTLLPRTTPGHTLWAIRVGEHGLSVQSEGRSGLLLPQVGSRCGWDARRFLEETCKKAGLAPDAWLDSAAEVRAFQGISFRGNLGLAGSLGAGHRLA